MRGPSLALGVGDAASPDLAAAAAHAIVLVRESLVKQEWQCEPQADGSAR
jgi:hypothetical protein